MNESQEKAIVKIVFVKHDNNNIATIGFIFTFFFPFIGFCLCIAACSRANRIECNGKGRGLAITGIVISIFTFFIEVIILYLLIRASSEIQASTLINYFIALK